MKHFLHVPRLMLCSALSILVFAGFLFTAGGGVHPLLRSEAQQISGSDLSGGWSFILYNYTCQSSGCPSEDTGCDTGNGTCNAVGNDLLEYWGGTECKSAGFGSGFLCHEILLWNSCAFRYNCKWNPEFDECELWQSIYIITPIDCEFI